MEEAKTQSHFQRAVVRISDYLIFLAIALVAVIVAVELLRSQSPLQISARLLVARTKGHFWTVKPAKILLFAVIGTQLTARLLTVYGILLPAMGWGLAAFVWGYALTLFVVTDFLKAQFYKLLGPQ